MRTHGSGYSLIELLITLTIVTILVLFSVPLTSIINKSKADTNIQILIRLVHLARNLAITQGEEITLCGTADLIVCEKSWHNIAIVVFADKNKNHHRDSNEPVLQQGSVADFYIRWNGARPYMRYRPDGTVIEFGTYTFCPPNHDSHYARQLTINAAGRAYLSIDRNGDGVHESNTAAGLIDCAT